MHGVAEDEEGGGGAHTCWVALFQRKMRPGACTITHMRTPHRAAVRTAAARKRACVRACSAQAVQAGGSVTQSAAPDHLFPPPPLCGFARRGNHGPTARHAVWLPV
jgi:hypothetical protein